MILTKGKKKQYSDRQIHSNDQYENFLATLFFLR